MFKSYSKNRYIYERMKENRNELKHISECITYKISKEEMDSYLSKYNK